MSINDLFKKGNILFKEKRFLEALQAYKEIWLKYPLNTRLNEEIIKKIKIYKEPIPQTFSKDQIERFFQFHKKGDLSTVINILLKYLEKDKTDILTISLLGKFYELSGDNEKSSHYHKMSIEKAPFEVAFYLNLSNSLKQSNMLEDALNILCFAKILSPSDKSIDYEMAKLNTTSKNYSEATSIYKKLIKDKNVSKEIIYSYCDNLIKNNKEDYVLEFLEKNKSLNSTDYYYQITLGLANFKKKEYNLAKTYFINSIKINPNIAQAYNLLADYYVAIDDLKNAKLNYKKSLSKSPNNNQALNNLAAVSFFEGNFKEAENIYNLAFKNNNNDYNSMYYLSQCQLAMCNYEAGWKNFEFRWFADQFKSKKLKTNLPKFFINSEKKNVLVWSEQGIGDQILFLRFLNDIYPHINTLSINIDSRLHRIIERMSVKVKFITSIDQIKDFGINSQISLGDLGYLFVKNNSNLTKSSKGYITSDFEISNNLKKTFPVKSKYICGLSWISKNEDIGDKKSISLDILKPILSIDKIEFLDLQYSDTRVERDSFFKSSGIEINKIEKIDNYNDLNGITSLVDICDFVITVSNTNAHISGALGKDTFLLLPKGKGKLWYWSSYKNRCFWYNSVQIIEQESIGSWDYPIKKLKKIIKEKING